MVEYSLPKVYDVRDDFTIEDARKLTKPAARIYCTLADNTAIRFGEYFVRDPDSGTMLLKISGDVNLKMDEYARKRETNG